MLQELGYKVTLCSDGPQAIEYYRESWLQVDLVVLDMIMPVLNGKETFLALQKINPQVKTVLCSGFSHNEQVQELLDMGALAFLAKPFEQMELSKIVASAIKSHKVPLI